MNNQKDTSTEQEINRKRKNSHDFQISRKFSSSDIEEEDHNDLLTLSLSCCPSPTGPRKLPPVQQQPPLPPPSQSSQPLYTDTPIPVQSFLSQPPPPQYQFQQLSPSHPLYVPHLPMPPTLVADPSPQPAGQLYRQESVGPSRPMRHRRNPSQAPREGKSETVPAPYPWATNHRATVYSLNYLFSKEIFKITGEVQCKRCDRQYEMDYDLREKFLEVGTFIAKSKSSMHDRAPGVWMNPVLPRCKFCDQENTAKPIISEKKKSINWLFLLLGQMLGCCTLEQLKYFCKHTKNHRTGAKDRVLFLAYLSLCKQLDPNGPFDR